jgi:hypothetical protein
MRLAATQNARVGPRTRSGSLTAASARELLRGGSPIPAINGRPVISRADMAARRVARTTVDGWCRGRARTGYPERAGRIGRTDYWYEDEWTAWYEAHLRAKIESLTQVDQSGDPDDLVDATEAARMLRYANRDVMHANRRLGYFPEPDAWNATAPRSAGWKPVSAASAARNCASC